MRDEVVPPGRRRRDELPVAAAIPLRRTARAGASFRSGPAVVSGQEPRPHESLEVERRKWATDPGGFGHIVPPDGTFLIDHPVIDPASDRLEEQGERLEIGNAMDHGARIVEAGPQELIDARVLWRVSIAGSC